MIFIYQCLQSYLTFTFWCWLVYSLIVYCDGKVFDVMPKSALVIIAFIAAIIWVLIIGVEKRETLPYDTVNQQKERVVNE